MILDSLTFVKETLEENLIIADTDNKLKMIYKQKKKIRKYRGFKNYCSSIVHLLFDSYE